MPLITGTTRSQTKFLRQCAADPLGMGGQALPRASTFRKWMRRPGFRVALEGIQDALRFQTDLHLAAAASTAASGLARAVGTAGDVEIEALTDSPEDDIRHEVSRPSGHQKLIDSSIALLRLISARDRVALLRAKTAPPPTRRLPHMSPEARALLAQLEEWAACGAHDSITIGQAKAFFEARDAAALRSAESSEG